VPTWQVILALGLLSISAFFIVRAAAGIFRAQNLLSGQKFNISIFLRALFSKL
jgi:ABC-2 type transport system permease protein